MEIIRGSTVTLLLCCIHFFTAAQKCVLKKDQDNIKVYSCANDSLPFKSIEATFVVKASLTEMAEALTDVERYTEWQFNTIQSHLLKKNNNSDLIYYIEVAAPWPISNRDLIVHFIISRDSSNRSIAVSANGIPKYLPVVDGLVRIPSSASQWKITEVSPGELSVRYSIQIDPGGSVPAWMANMVAANAPFESFQNLRRRIETLRSANNGKVANDH